MTNAATELQGHCRAGLRPLTLLAAVLLGITILPSGAAEHTATAGRKLAERQGCLGCHATKSQLVGPSYEAVAARYREQKDAAAELALHIRSGSSGRWGTVAMPPQPQLGEADARRLARWILDGAR